MIFGTLCRVWTSLGLRTPVDAAIVDALPESEDVETDLRRFARQHISTVMQPHLLQMRRTIIAEADQSPDLAPTWYASGPERGHATPVRRFTELARRGLLRMDDPLFAAQHFNWLILSIPLNKVMFHGPGEHFTPSELERYADEGVRVFLAAYGAPDPAATPGRARRSPGFCWLRFTDQR